jgi:hypothetical protein
MEDRFALSLPNSAIERNSESFWSYVHKVKKFNEVQDYALNDELVCISTAWK